jgi:RNA polymerase sigma-70 factor (ECF subfamily)
MDDRQLLSAYLSKSSTDAFGQIVRQNIDLVYSAARRQLGDSHLAEDVTQVVFLLLSRKAWSVKGPLAGWLLTATHFASRDARKLAARREYHERQAALMRPEQAVGTDEPRWETYAPILDDAMAQLKASDRDAVALRYLRGFSLEQVGVALGVNAKAAEKRVGRAVGRLRATLAIKGAVPSVAVLATHLTARGTEAAPAKLAETIAFTGTSVAKGTLVSTIARMTGQAMYWTNAKIAAMVLATLTVAGAGTGTFFILADNPPPALTLPALTPPAVTPPALLSTVAPGANNPRVIFVSPANGATNVDTKQELRIRFDQPMNPNDLEISWSSGGFLSDGQPRYEPDRDEFVIPVRLIPGQTNELRALSSSAFGGFRTPNLTYAGDYRWHFTTKAGVAKPGAVKPKVIQISPASGEVLPVLTLLEFTFDQPMMPPDQGFPYLWKTDSFSLDLPARIPFFDYDPSSHRFTVPVVMPPNNDTKLTLQGFTSIDGVPSDPVVIHCQIGTNSYSSEQLNLIATAAKDPKLEHLLSAMKTAREGFISGIETVQWTRCFGGADSFGWITANSPTFKWKGANQIYADISGIMNSKAFILGSDGKTCWLYADGPNGRRLDTSPAALVPDIDASIADPFALTRRTVQSAIAEERLIYEGQAKLDERTCHRVQSWIVHQPQGKYDLGFAAKTEWWIDAQTLLPVQVVRYGTYGIEQFSFHYEELNQPIPDADFQPPAATGIIAKKNAFKLFERQAPAPGERRFLTIKDGCDGQMRGSLGWSEPGGRTVCSGLN